MNINLVNPEQAELQIEFDFDELQDTVIETDLSIQKLQIERKIVLRVQQDFVKQKYQKTSEIKLEDQKERVREDILDIDDNYNIDNRKSINNLWNNIIFPRWKHSDSAVGYRFLGNIDIEKLDSDRIINAVGKNLQKLIEKLKTNNNNLEPNLLKIITFALSEYAYYYSEKGEGFWKGFCDHIRIEHNQIVEKILREITEKGVNSLKLIKVQKSGYKYVSTLWLQSDVPKRNMSHFATIVQDVSNECGWWEIAHSSTGEVYKALLECWENKYKSWGTIGHFLKIDKIDEEIEPISERLVKNIAIVAKELEHQGITPEQLQDEKVKNKIDEILHDSNLNLSNSFFLRDWSDLITVLTPRKGKSDRNTLKRRNQPPYLYLDITDTLNIQLILPEQSLWEQEWHNLRGTYCYIPEAGWEDNIPSQGNLEIPELQINIKQAADKWTCYLQDHNCNQIYQWKHQGINLKFPCLVFDAISGEYINIDISEPVIIGIEEIILFTPKEIKIELDSDVEVIVDYVSLSIKY